MSFTSLKMCADSLFGCLQGIYWDRDGWKGLKQDVETLATCLSSYADNLAGQGQSMI